MDEISLDLSIHLTHPRQQGKLLDNPAPGLLQSGKTLLWDQSCGIRQDTQLLIAVFLGNGDCWDLGADRVLINSKLFPHAGDSDDLST